MNPTQRALYVMLSRLLIAERTPSGRPMTNAEWWLTLAIAEIAGGLDG